MYAEIVLICIQQFRESLAPLTYVFVVVPYGDIDLGQYWTGNGILPDDTKPISELMTTHPSYVHKPVLGPISVME